jgi:sugar lactone lactonase YvrE
VSVLAAVLILLIAVAVSLAMRPNAAVGDEEGGSLESLAPTAAQTEQLLESGRALPITEASETDLHAAQVMPHRDLDRGEALELAQEVFGAELEAPSSIYDNLEVDGYVSNNAAIVPISSLSEVSGDTGSTLATEHPNQPVLLESSLPLRTRNAEGDEEAVSLEVERSEGELQPKNPLTEVGIPERLGEGLSLLGGEVGVKVAGAPADRAATNADGEFAFYPEVADDTDLIAEPSPRGLDALTDIRSAEAPLATTYDLTLSEGAELRSDQEGGAEIVEGSRTAVSVSPPTATDAAGNSVPVELSVAGDSMTVAVSPGPSTAYPILVDPDFTSESWNWAWAHQSVWSWSPATTNGNTMEPFPYAAWESTLPGLDLTSAPWSGASTVGTHADWEYWVPRYREEISHGRPAPTSWVYSLEVEGAFFRTYGDSSNYPAMVLGLVDPHKGWGTSGVHYGGQGEMTNWNNRFVYPNEYEQEGDKGADMNLVTYEAENPPRRRDAYLATAFVGLVDNDTPKFNSEVKVTEGWLGNATVPIEYEAEDTGLGVQRVMAVAGKVVAEKSLAPCATAEDPCPRIVSSTTLPISVNTESLPTGLDYVTLDALDPLAFDAYTTHSHGAAAAFRLKVDHTGPEVTLSGPLAEQASTGTRRAGYPLRIAVTDGTSSAPQSGVGSVEVKVDGKKVAMPEEAEWDPACKAQNCHMTGEWTMSTANYAAGPHRVEVVAEDAVGNKTTKTLNVELNPPPPTLSISGTMTEQASLGTERPSYTLKVNASALAESPTAAATPTYSSSFGSPGTGSGQLSRPEGMAMDTEGDIWVADSLDNRLEEFNGSGGYMGKIAPESGSRCALTRPTAIAIDAAGDLWVTDSGVQKVVEFSGSGNCLAVVGEGQFHGRGPEGIAVDSNNDIWVADTYGGRLLKFNEGGILLRSVATKGTGNGQLGQPDGLAIALGNRIYVSDWEDDKVAEYDEGGNLVRQFGTAGTGSGQLEQPTGVTVDAQGDVWIGDEKNERIDEFTQAGEYVASFGAAGSGAGQFELSYPTGIVTDARGDVWVSDVDAGRIERWVEHGYHATPTAPTFTRAFGTTGTAAGQQEEPVDVAVDAKGDLWVVDRQNDTLQRYGARGEYEASFSGPGTAAGKLQTPLGLAISGGHIWVSDSGNNRLEEFNEAGAYLATFGKGGTGNAEFSYPSPPAIDSSHHIWVADAGNNRVQELTESGGWVRTIGTSGTGKLNDPQDVAVGPGNTVFVADYGNNRVVEFSETGAFVRQIGGAGETGSLNQPIAVYVDPSEHVWVVERGQSRVKEYSVEGTFLGEFASAGSGPGQLTTPAYVSGDEAGHLFVADDGDHRIEEWSQGYVSTTTPTFSRAFGTAGTAAGQQEEPVDVAVDAKGDLWVVDRQNDTLQRYGAKGEYEASYSGPGTAAGKLQTPLGLAISGGHIWVSDSGNNRLEEFNEAGAYLATFGKGGTGNAEFSYPSPPAIDSAHHIWVADAGNNRVQELTESGAWVRTIGTSGTGKLNSPQDVAVGPGNTVFVADYGGNRVVEFSETGAFIRQIGGGAAETTQFANPIAVYVDAEEHLWVVERGQSRIKEYTTEGAYLGQFGSAGSGPGQLTAPAYVSGDEAGHLFVADDGDHRIEEWAKPATHSQISTEVSVEGVRKQGSSANCATKTCSASGEWNLPSSSLSPGPHNVKVTATDGLGNTTTKTLNIELKPDHTAPSLKVSGELYAAPNGWIEQEEGIYDLSATATDAGSGLDLLEFTIDGKSVTTRGFDCPKGGCQGSISAAVNARTLTAGAHVARLKAMDQAGNAISETWVVNVDPEGNITTAEAQATIEAVEETGTALPDDPTVLGTESGGGSPRVGVSESGTIPVSGTQVPISISKDPGDGVKMEIADQSLLTQGCGEIGEEHPEGGETAERELEVGQVAEESTCSEEEAARQKLEEEAMAQEESIASGLKQVGLTPITITPKGLSPQAGSTTPVEGSATVTPNAQEASDTFFRPMAAGGFTFEDIRSAAAPEHYAYELSMNTESTELVQLNSQEIALKYIEGPVSFVITAIPAHDEIGTSVPTHIAITSPKVITLTVEHRGTSPAGGSFAYPVMVGVGWEGGFRTISVEFTEPPPPPAPGSEEHGSVERENGYLRTRASVFGPGLAYTHDGGGQPEANPKHWFAFSECIDFFAYKAKVAAEQTSPTDPGDLPDFEVVGNCIHLVELRDGLYRGDAVRGWAHVNEAGWVWLNEDPECVKWGPARQALVHCYVHPKKVQGTLTVGSDFRTGVGTWFPEESQCFTIYGHINGRPAWLEEQETIETQVEEGDPCHWPAE